MRSLFIFSLCFFVISTFTAVAKNSRSAKPMAKGVELYSWRNSSSLQWAFSLLPGTNRNKNLKEIKAPQNVIVGVQDLKIRMEALAVGEEIYWFNNDAKALSYPPKKVRDDISKAARNLQIRLYIPTQK